MIVRNVSRGRSFTKLAAYLTSEREGHHRALWSSVENVGATSPKTAAKIMAATDIHADELKAAAGVKATGRKARDGPVYHLVMSWADGQQPDQTHQLEAARDMLRAIDLDRAQAVIVAHNDNGREHLHIMVNLVNPETGKRFALSNDRHKMQEWALGYERQNGGVLIERREQNAESWAKGEAQDKAPSLPRAVIDRAARDAAFAQQAAERAAMRAEHGDQWKQAKSEAAQYRAAYKAAFRDAYARQKAAAKVDNKPLWRDVFSRQRAERDRIERAAMDARRNAESARRLAEKATRAAQKAERRQNSTLGRLAQRIGLVQGPEASQQRQQQAAALMERAAMELARAELAKAQLAAKQEADRRAIAKRISADTFAKAQMAVDEMPRADFAAMIAWQDDQRRQMIERHNAERVSLGMKPYEPKPPKAQIDPLKKGPQPVSPLDKMHAREDETRRDFAASAARPDRRAPEQPEQAAPVQGAGMQPSPRGLSRGNTPAAPDKAKRELVEAQRSAAAQAEAQRTSFKPHELQTRREGDKAPAFDKGPEGARGASPLDKARERNNTPEAKAERSAQRAFDRARQRDDFGR